MQSEPRQIKASIDNYSGGKLSDRCKVIYAAYTSHVLSLNEMTYALMQYELSEIAAGNIRTDRFIPDKPDLPDKDAERDVWASYKEKLGSYQVALDKNYDGEVSIRKAEAFKLALKDDDYDYSKAKEWGAYIVIGVVDGAVKIYLGDLIPAPVEEIAEEDDDIPF